MARVWWGYWLQALTVLIFHLDQLTVRADRQV
jgi:hypothetical protein